MLCRFGQGGQVVGAGGGPQTRVNNSVQAVCQGQFVGRCRVALRAEDATRAGTVMSFRRIVVVVALARSAPVMVAAARVSSMYREQSRCRVG